MERVIASLRDRSSVPEEFFPDPGAIRSGVLRIERPRIFVATEDDFPSGPMPDVVAEGDLMLHVWSPGAMPRNLTVRGDLRLIVAGAGEGEPMATRLLVGGNLDLLDTTIALPDDAEIHGFVSSWLHRVVRRFGPVETRPEFEGKGFLLLGRGPLVRPEGYLVDDFPRAEVLARLRLRHRPGVRLAVAERFLPAYMRLLDQVPSRHRRGKGRLIPLDPAVTPIDPDPRWFDGRFDGRGPS